MVVDHDRHHADTTTCPVTAEGRIVAVALMIGGISLVGIVTATLASWIVQRVAEEDTAQQAATTRRSTSCAKTSGG